MFHLASSLYSHYTKREQYNVLILGLDNAGKTTFFEHLKMLYQIPDELAETRKKKQGDEVDTVDALKHKRILPTVGQNTTTIKFELTNPLEVVKGKGGRSILLKFWDLGGQQLLRLMWLRYYDQCHGIVFIIDLTDTDRFQECYDTIVDIAHHNAWEGVVNVPILMLANKQDLPQAVDLVQLKTGVFIQLVLELEATDSKLLPVLVLENQGLREALEWLVLRLVYNKGNRPPDYR